MNTDQQKPATNLIDFLKQHIEKYSFVHHKRVPEQKEIIKKELTDFPDNISKIIQISKIPHLKNTKPKVSLGKTHWKKKIKRKRI
tara:strand:- start:62 stop:316 length:255 start_codon:yes stop_codon:yes gene_type:complete